MPRCLKSFARPTIASLFLLLMFLLTAVIAPSAIRAQGNPAPPPPPAEGLDPTTAPSSSRETTPAARPATSPSPNATSTANNGAPPPPPSEALDPAHAPVSSTGMPPVPPPVVSPTETGSHGHSAGASDHVEGDHPADTESAKASPATVFQLDFMQRALMAGVLVGGACAFLGVYVVLRRIVFVGVALAEMSSAGVALAILTGIAPMLGSVIVMLLGVFLVSVRWGGRRIRQDAFIGIGYVIASAASILLLAKSASGEGSLLEILFGNILTVTALDIRATAIALGLMLLFHALFYKEMLFVAFDPDTAAASGYRSRLWELWLYVSIGLTIAFSIHAVGVMLTFASLVIPPVTALLFTRRMGTAFGFSIAAGTLPVPIGLYLSFVADLPAAATVVAVGFVFLLIAGVVSRLQHA
jgi:ABC-type Mn2+/Zn2+ transport system permease subunit